MKHFDIKENTNFKLAFTNINEKYEIRGDYLEHENVSYKINSDGYRGKDVDGVADIMALGCSFTFGVGLPEEKVWPSILSNKMNMSMVNLASPGDSAMGQVRKAFAYFEKYGNPKIIVCLFPTLRLELPVNPERLAPKYLNKKHYDPIARLEIRGIEDSKYIKAPFDPSEVLIPEIPFYYSHLMINILQQYCKSNGIKFIWSVWEDFYDNVYDFINSFSKDYYKNFCKLSFSKWDRRIENNVLKEFKNGENEITCHNEYQDDFFFHTASDIYEGLNKGHAGFHRNMHIAEEFYDFINKDKNEKE